MGIEILFRRNPAFSPFRRALNDLIKYPGRGNETLLLGSGFIKSDILLPNILGCNHLELSNSIAQGYSSSSQSLFDLTELK